MPDSIEQKVDSHRIAAARRAQGRSVWQHTIKLGDIFHNEDLTFEQRRDQIAFRLKNSSWLKAAEEFDPIHEMVEELAEVRDDAEFNMVWDAIYDEANYARAWITTIA